MREMSRYLFVLIFPGLLAVPGALAQMSADGSHLLLTEDSLHGRRLSVSGVDCTSDHGDVVALDTSNGATLDDHKILVADLLAAGFTVRTLNLAVDGIPSCVRHLMITTQGFNACLTTPYPAPLVDLITNSVRSGLGLFLLNEWGDFCGAGSAPMANALGATWSSNAGASQTCFAGLHFDPDNPATLFQGVRSWTQFVGSDYTAFTGVAVRTDAGQPALIAKRFERGCVVIAGDSNWVADRWVNAADNRTLASNVFAFLNECTRRIVDVDLKPGSNPNCVNPRSRGRVPVAVHGAEDFDVTTIDPSSLSFGGAAAVRCSLEDVESEGPTGVFSRDGWTDLVCHFKTQEVTLPPRGSDCGDVALTGERLDGGAIEGGDIVCIPGELTCESGLPIPVD